MKTGTGQASELNKCSPAPSYGGQTLLLGKVWCLRRPHPDTRLTECQDGKEGAVTKHFSEIHPAEVAEHAGVELGRDQGEDVVAEEGQRHGAQQRQREQPGPPVAPPRLFAPLRWLWPGREARELGVRGGPRGRGGRAARVVAEGRAGHGVREVTRHHVTGFLC